MGPEGPAQAKISKEIAMALCKVCGATIEGDFCAKCGTQQSAPPAGKKRRTLYWVLGGCLGLILITIVIVVGSGVYFLRKSGFDPALAVKSPAQATANMMAKLDPNLEIVSVDESTGIIRMREKKSGRIMRKNVKDGRKSHMIYYEDIFKNAGFTIKRSVIPIPLKGESIVIAAEDVKGKRNARVTAERSKELTKVTFEFENKE
jgi:hypothetical protein